MGSDNDKQSIRIDDNINILRKEKLNHLMENFKCLIKIRKNDAYLGNGFFL